MKQFIGIYSDAEPTKRVEVVSFSFSQNTTKTNQASPVKKTGIGIFTAENLVEAMKKAKELGYSSFAQIDGKIYYENHDY